MHHSTRAFALAAAVCAAGWLVKMGVLALTGGGDNAAVTVLWTTGLVGLLVTTATAAVALLRGRPTWMRVVGAIVGVPVGFVLMVLSDSAVVAVVPGHGWFHEELGLVALALLAGTASLVTFARVSRGGAGGGTRRTVRAWPETSRT
jgi:hypothetical protein